MKKYREYIATLNQYPQTAITSGRLIVGETYQIGTSVAGDDFSNVVLEGSGIGEVNTNGFIFTASGTTPKIWNGTELHNNGNIIPVLLENSFGYTPTWSVDGFSFNEQIKPSKVITNFDLKGSNTCYYELVDNYLTEGIGHFNNRINTIVKLENGNLILGGSFTQISGLELRLGGIVELDKSGNIISDFNGGFSGKEKFGINSIKVQSDGKILVGGDFTSYQGIDRTSLVRLNSDYSLDTTFASTNGPVYTIEIQSDNKVLLGGDFNQASEKYYTSCLVRLNSDDSIDTTFNIGLGIISSNTPIVKKIVVQSDSKILVGGEFDGYQMNYNDGSQSIPYLIRYNSDGTVDREFYLNINASYGNLDGPVYDIKLLDDGGILLAGDFSNYLIKLDSDGNYDDAFNSNISFDGDIYSILVFNDRIYVGGIFTNYFTILNMDGTTYDDYSTIAEIDNAALTITEMDGKIYIGGDFTYNLVVLNVTTQYTLNYTTLSDTGISIKVY